MSLPSLPFELLILIFENCALEPIETSSCRPIGLQHRTNRAALFNVSLTCRRLRKVATPLLYKHPIVVNSTQLALLASCLLRCPSLRPHIRSFASLVCLVDEQDGRRAAKRFRTRTMRDISPDDLDDDARTVLTRCYILSERATEFLVTAEGLKLENHAFLQRITAVIMLLCTSIENIFLRYPDYFERNCLYNQLDFLRVALFGKSGSATLARSGTVLPNLQTVRVQANPEFISSGTCRYDNGAELLLLPHLFWGPSLRQIEIFGDDGNYTHNSAALARYKHYPEKFFSFLSQVQHLSFYHALGSPCNILQLLKRCQQLEHLQWTFRQATWLGNGVESDDGTLDAVLNRAAGTLRFLHIESLTPDPRFTRRSPPEDRKFQTLTTLGRFHNLEHLVIDTMTIFGSCHEHRLQSDGLDLASLLPPNLVSLELIERSIEDAFQLHEFSDAHDDWIFRLFRCFGQGCLAEQSRLRKFVFRAFMPHNTMAGLGDRPRSNGTIKQLTDVFAESGVEFLWVWQCNL